MDEERGRVTDLNSARDDDGSAPTSLREIVNLLEDADSAAANVPAWKKYARLVLPHVGLVTVVCIYAMVGAWVFYSLESPNEDRLKASGVERVHRMRSELLHLMWQREQLNEEEVDDDGGSAERPLSKSEWTRRVDTYLQHFNEHLYRAYKERYVRYGDVRLPNSSHARPRSKRQVRTSRTRSERGGKLWTAASSLFFAATTMATIGYGNIVPVTSHGRIACIVFALFGAPLAIITIGDLGKFLSECTIWLYRRMKEKERALKESIARWSARRGLSIGDDESLESGRHGDGRSQGGGDDPGGGMEDWDDLGKAEVPVLLVFAILLLYIALGGVLFAALESWTYMDAFYYCFVSLTTIGFGDLVPDRHEYIVLMLIYLGVGLAVTTMCIDLVGIQYIQKIHYFGRKFKGTDILQILRRKRMLERRFAMGEGKEFIEYVIQVTQEQRAPRQLPPLKMAHLRYNADGSLEEERISFRSVFDEPPMLESAPTKEAGSSRCSYSQVQETPQPEILKAPLPSPTVTNSSESGRSLLYDQWSRLSGGAGEWAESGPSLSLRCSLSTSASVAERERLYEREELGRDQTPESYKFTFPPPSPDWRVVADEARFSRRTNSCPTSIPMASPSHSSPSPPNTNTTTSISSPSSSASAMESPKWRRVNDDYHPPTRMAIHGHRPLIRFQKIVTRPLWYHQQRRRSLLLSSKQQSLPPRSHAIGASSSAMDESTMMAQNDHSEQSGNPAHSSSHLPMAVINDESRPVLQRKKLQRLAKRRDPLGEIDWLNLSPRMADFEEVVLSGDGDDDEEDDDERDESGSDRGESTLQGSSAASSAENESSTGREDL